MVQEAGRRAQAGPGPAARGAAPPRRAGARARASARLRVPAAGLAAALTTGRGQRRGTSAWFLSKELGMSEDWCRRHRKRFFKRFTPQWKPALTKANVAKRLKASKKHVAFYKKRGWKSQVIIHEDEKWFIRGAPQAIWAGKDEPPVFKHSPRVAKLQREKIMVHATVSNVPGAAKISLVFCEKDQVAQTTSKHHKRHEVY